MHKNAKFEKLTKIPGTSKVVQGIKNGRVPSNAVAGGNGSFVVADRAKLILSVRDEEGQWLNKDIYLDVKDYTSRRITDKFCEELETQMRDFDFIVENNNIVNLDEVLANIE